MFVCMCVKKDFKETSLEYFYLHAGAGSGDDGLIMISREWETLFFYNCQTPSTAFEQEVLSIVIVLRRSLI